MLLPQRRPQTMPLLQRRLQTMLLQQRRPQSVSLSFSSMSISVDGKHYSVLAATILISCGLPAQQMMR